MADEHSLGSPEYEHAHGDEHQHDRGFLARIKGLFSPHSHDAAVAVDAALETSRQGNRALFISFVGLALTAILQAIVVFLSQSVALLGDTLHNFADALTAIPLAIAFTLGRRAPTRRFTYGYGRSEDLAGIIVVLLIAGSSALAGYEAIRRLLHPQDLQYLWLVAIASVIGFLGNELVARYRIKVGREIGSAALVADGLHARTDGLTSLGVLVGAIGVAVGFRLADPIVGLAITVAILFVLRDAGREVLRRLMDAVDPELVEQIRSELLGTPGRAGTGRRPSPVDRSLTAC
jgi:cation diffusion facilitator family transporter